MQNNTSFICTGVVNRLQQTQTELVEIPDRMKSEPKSMLSSYSSEYCVK